MPDESEADVITTARVNRCRDSTPLGIGLYNSGPQLLRLGIDPVETDAVDLETRNETLYEEVAGNRVVPDDTD